MTRQKDAPTSHASNLSVEHGSPHLQQALLPLPQHGARSGHAGARVQPAATRRPTPTAPAKPPTNQHAQQSFSLRDHEPARLPQHASTSAAQQLSPSYPRRAPWGTAQNLRAWQAAALQQYLDAAPRDFLAVATPGAGKTTFALRIVTELLAAGVVRRVTVVAPTEHLKNQWADAARRVGVHLDPAFTNAQGKHGAHFQGVCVTYAQVAAAPALHRARTEVEPTLVIFDEVHHAGDALSWGDAVEEAFTPARRRLSLTGTPFRSDTAKIPFVEYTPDGNGVLRSRADYSYGYSDALRDGVVRPVMFLSYSGEMRWRTRQGDEVAATLGEPLTKDMQAQALRTALDPDGTWIRDVFTAADQRLTEVRRSMPDAGGLVIATDQTTARAYARLLTAISGEKATTVLSDDAGASGKIDEFSASDRRWLVAVRMVSEGVDIPRLAVGVYATQTSTPLFFAQAVGRFVRARRRGETASVFLPSAPHLLALAGELELQRDHVLGKPGGDGEVFFNPEDLLVAQANREERASEELTLPGFAALDSQANFDKVLFDGGEYGTGGAVGSDAELDFLGIPGLLEPEQVTDLLRARQAEQVARQKKEKAAAELRAKNSGVDDHRRRQAARKELSALVAAWARRSGMPHGVVHNELRSRCGGPEVALATTEQIEARIALLRRWFVGKK